MQNQKLSTYKGNYDIFERTREEQVKNQQKAFESSERSRSHMQVSFLFLKIELMNSVFNSSLVFLTVCQHGDFSLMHDILFSATGVH